MTVHKLSAGDGYTYLTRQVASGDRQRRAGEDLAGYYTATGNPPGRWMGAGASALGVTGQVGESQMVALFGHGLHPDTDRIAQLERAAGADESAVRAATRLGQPFRQVSADSARKPVAGYDLVFTPVKSVSLLWALGDDSTRQAVEQAHHEAVAATIGWLEQHAAFTRTGRGGIAQVDTDGLVCAAFDHRDSRLGDPDLHTHVAISNKVCTRATDDPHGRGRWLALDGRALYQAGVAASERYNTRLEDAVARRLGVQFSERSDTVRADKRSVREVTGIPLHLIQAFSQRRRQVEARYADLAADYRNAHGHQPGRAAQIKLAQQATLETREGKQKPKALGEQLQQWRSRARRLLGEQDPRQLVHGVIGRQVAATRVDAELVDRTARAVVGTVEAERATGSRWTLIAEIERATRGWRFPTLADRERAMEAVFTAATHPDRSIRIAVPELVAEPDALRRADGQSVFTPHASERYTSRATLAAEEGLVAAGREPTGLAATTALAEQVIAVLTRRTGQRLDPGQARLVEAFACDDRRLVAGIGPAGSGKTTAMRATCAIWDADGRRVIPLAASAKAADVLSAELGRRAENLHKFLHELDQPTTPSSGDVGFFALRRGDVVLVDESGMAGTHRLHRLVQHAQTAGAVVRLLGDPQQLACPEAGGALRLLATDVGAVELTRLHRFTDPAEAAATLGLRRGEASALDFYETRDRIRAGSEEAMVDDAFAGWRADMLTGRATAMGTPTAELAAELSARARLDRVALGAVAADGARLHDGNTAGVGDWILTRDNNRHLLTHRGADFVKNGDRWTVTAHHDDGALTVQHQRHHGVVTLPADYVAAHVELAYATTAHRLQGDTVDTAHPIITPGTSREALYVLASRAREHTTLYVATEPCVDVATEHAPPPERNARDVLVEVLHTQASQLSATETIRQTLTDGTRLSTLTAQYTHVADHATQHPDAADWPAHLQQRADAIRHQALAQRQARQSRSPIPPPVPTSPSPSQERGLSR